MQKYEIGIIGTGHMATKLLQGWQRSGQQDVAVYGRNQQQVRSIQQQFQVSVCECLSQLWQSATIVLVCVRPDQLADLCEEIRAQGDLKQVPEALVSVVAGVSLSWLDSQLPQPLSVFRAMPNLPVSQSQGVIGLLADPAVPSSLQIKVEGLFAQLGVCFQVQSDKEIDLITALAGSGPGYVYYFMEVLADAAKSLGLTEVLAERITEQLVFGSAQLAQNDPESVKALREKVCVPGGTTEQGVLRLIDGKVDVAVKNAIAAAYEKAQEIARQYQTADSQDSQQ